MTANVKVESILNLYYTETLASILSVVYWQKFRNRLHAAAHMFLECRQRIYAYKRFKSNR